MKRGPARRLARAALAGLERLLLPGDGPFAWSPTFVQGAPRSGTTLVYQAIVARWRCSFFSNRERACAPYPLLAARLGRAAARFEPTFDSEFGAIRGRDAPVLAGVAYAMFKGRIVALGEIEKGALHPTRVFNFGG